MEKNVAKMVLKVWSMSYAIPKNVVKINFAKHLIHRKKINYLLYNVFKFSGFGFSGFHYSFFSKTVFFLVGAKPQEDFSLSKNETSAVGGRPSAAGGRVGQFILGGRLLKVSSRRSTVGSRRSVLLANFFLSMISLIKNFSGASCRI